ncbi:L-aminoadipate-semialdehyde dehydrogenase-phosphopantetheinyl transferase-like [Bacillus rossius redtenbacheri]|uniref:L-aminoadipate-semialdehyde dehydrogenase-phosphopantetheinyl transferase-like n=1 Tax=Bacillus rossius redtenbacheri TaxID=93214 RepID=UPI002FDE4D25
MSVCIASTKRARWTFNVKTWQPTEAQFLLASACVQEEEKARIGRFVFKNDAKATLIGRLMMRKFVSSTSGIPYSEVKFWREEKGKPYVLNPVVNFNISHDGDHVVLAGEEVSTKVGVDVMRLEHRSGTGVEEFFRTMSRQFTAEEWECIRGKSLPSKQLATFYRHWCLKESYLKALGMSITSLGRYGFKTEEPDLRVGTVARGTRVYVDGILADNWCFEETMLDEDHCVAVALSKSTADCSQDHCLFHFLDFEQLMKGSEPILQPDLEYTRNFFAKNEKIIRPIASILDTNDKN